MYGLAVVAGVDVVAVDYLSKSLGTVNKKAFIHLRFNLTMHLKHKIWLPLYRIKSRLEI